MHDGRNQKLSETMGRPGKEGLDTEMATFGEAQTQDLREEGNLEMVWRFGEV